MKGPTGVLRALRPMVPCRNAPNLRPQPGPHERKENNICALVKKTQRYLTRDHLQDRKAKHIIFP
jgi:hypothetical protein